MNVCDLFLRLNRLHIANSSFNSESSATRLSRVTRVLQINKEEIAIQGIARLYITVVKKNAVIIGGAGMTVQIDESLFTHRKNNAGRVLPQQFGGIYLETKKCFVSSSTCLIGLMPPIHRWIRPPDRQSCFVNPVTGAYTQIVERMWRIVKFRNKKQSGTDDDSMESYLAKYVNSAENSQ